MLAEYLNIGYTITNKIKSISFEEKDAVLKSYEELKKNLFENSN